MAVLGEAIDERTERQAAARAPRTDGKFVGDDDGSAFMASTDVEERVCSATINTGT